ncbi:MAG TPA: hypothetical protein VN519_10920 [Bryobacteraceae bacterium]|nr:hypothetical protein [Bryobacteraceae bacterium]
MAGNRLRGAEMILPKKIVLAFLLASSICAQTRTDEVAVLPLNTDTPELVLAPPDNVGATAMPSAGVIRGQDNKPLSPQPVVSVGRQEGLLKVKLSRVFFWGDAALPLTFTLPSASKSRANPKSVTVTYTLTRGVTVSPSEIDIPRNEPGVIWIHNPDVTAVQARWRVVSGTESLCGLDPQGQLRRRCDDALRLPEIRIPPTRSIPLRVYVPSWWRDPLHVVTGSDVRLGELQLMFGQDNPMQEFDAGLKLRVYSNALDAVTAWLPDVVYNLIRVLLWITVGAVLLMLAQVIIPNFRRSLQMEARIDGFRERLRAINSAVGNRLYTRCQNEIARVTESLGIREPDSKPLRSGRIFSHVIRVRSVGQSISVFNLDRVVLCGNSQEIIRLEMLLPRIESRLTLTERLSDVLTGFLRGDALGDAPTSVFDREGKLSNLREILSRQLLTDAEEANADAILRQLETGCESSDDFEAGLNTRLEALRRQLSQDVFKTKAAKYIAKINGGAEVIAESPASVPKSGWTEEELVFRDLIAVKLRIVVFAVEIENLLAKDPQMDAWIQEKLQSKDPIVISKINAALNYLSEGISEGDIRTALENRLWDTLWEPPSVRSQDVLQFAFLFRDKAFNSSSAKDAFRCYWKIVDSYTHDESWEEGWCMQYIPSYRHFTVTPAIYDSTGNEVTITSPDDPEKGRAEIRVTSITNASGRAVRGIVDAVITALVPVVTVALTQVQNGGMLSVDKLVLLGFTSQAIRAAILPESVGPEAAAPNSINVRAAAIAPAATAADAGRSSTQTVKATG